MYIQCSKLVGLSQKCVVEAARSTELTNEGSPSTTAIQSSMPQTTQPACASSVKTAAAGYGTVAHEEGCDFEFENEVMADDCENPCGHDPCTSIGGGVATFKLVPQPAPHRVSGCVSQMMGDGTCGDRCSLLPASLQKLECTVAPEALHSSYPSRFWYQAGR
jgi:hypothetical protein